MGFDIVKNHPIAPYLSWKTGGKVSQFYTPRTHQELAQFLAQNTLPILWLGLGSNLLISEAGFTGVVIYTKHLNHLSHHDNIITAETGVPLAKISRLASRLDLHGAEFFSSIPGTVGGALAMNAGCFEFETWANVTSVKTINKKGVIHLRNSADFKVGYRQVIAINPDEYFLLATLKFSQTPNHTNIRQLLEKRRKSQPIGKASCGSVFKNPYPRYAGALIEQAGLKGYCIGGACISEKHANFIINTGTASATNIQNLIIYIQKTIKSQFDITLQTEVKIF